MASPYCMVMKTDITTDRFDDAVLQSDLPVLVDFWADWCMPCKMMEPVLDDLAAEYEGKLVIVRVNVDEEQDLANRYEVVSIPSFLLFHNGKVVAEHLGAAPTARMKEMLAPVLSQE